jgi:hypothetical protein
MIEHIQKTYCYCLKCQEKILICEYIIQDGDMFVTVDPEQFGWKRFSYKGRHFWLCPKHTVEETVVIDGEKMPDFEA